MTLLERMARAHTIERAPDESEADYKARVLAVLREEQAPTDARMVTVIRALCDGPTLPDEVEDGKAAMERVKAALAPRWDAPTNDPLTPETMAEAMDAIDEKSARFDADHLAAMGVDPRRAHLAVAPPPP